MINRAYVTEISKRYKDSKYPEAEEQIKGTIVSFTLSLSAGDLLGIITTEEEFNSFDQADSFLYCYLQNALTRIQW